jgi:hypothetical protein
VLRLWPQIAAERSQNSKEEKRKMLKFGIYVGDSPNVRCSEFLGFIWAWTNDGAYAKAVRKFGEKLTSHIVCVVERG